jgi:hypothetical protein
MVCSKMAVKITQINLRETAQYPWTHRVDIDKDIIEDVYNWELGCTTIPGIWVGDNVFYTNSKGATYMALRWSQ